MPVKAPPPPPPPPSWWSGFAEFDYASFDINPQGLALIPHSTETFQAGLNLTLYKDKTGFINNFTVGAVAITDWSNSFDGYWAGGEPSSNGSLFDIVLLLTQSVTFGQYWTLSNTYANVYSQDVGPVTSVHFAGFPFLNFDEIRLSLNDSFTGWPITFNPYVAFYYEFTGGLAGADPACFTCQNNAGDFFIGITPTLGLEKYWGIPVTLKAPTYVTVGSSSFWAGPNGMIPTPALGLTGASSGGVGIFTTGLTAVIPLKFMLPQYGAWYVKGGFQWYDIINTALQSQNAFSTGCLSDGCTKNIIVGFAGIGVAF